MPITYTIDGKLTVNVRVHAESGQHCWIVPELDRKFHPPGFAFPANAIDLLPWNVTTVNSNGCFYTLRTRWINARVQKPDSDEWLDNRAVLCVLSTTPIDGGVRVANGGPVWQPAAPVDGVSLNATLDIEVQGARRNVKSKKELNLYNKNGGVDLVVDFGNTRTACYLVDTRIKFGIDPYYHWAGRKVPVRFLESCRLDWDKTYCVAGQDLVNSMLAFEEPVSATWGDVGDIMSEQDGGVVLGGRVSRLSQLLGGNNAVFGNSLPFLSSPKRYIWDDRLRGTQDGVLPEWQWIRQPWCVGATGLNLKPIPNRLFHLKAVSQNPGLAVANSGGDNKDDDDSRQVDAVRAKTCEPVFPVPFIAKAAPRRQVLSWSVMTILEQAWQTIGLHDWPDTRPSFGRVVVVFPSGWGEVEQRLYKALWQEGLEAWKRRHGIKYDLELSMKLDEAMASLLPILVGEFEKINSNGWAWGQAVHVSSQTTPDGENNSSVRVMSVDIGGGSTDVAVTSLNLPKAPQAAYFNSSCDLRFSSPTAGDGIVRRVIQNILLPALAECTANRDEVREKLRKFFGPQSNVPPTELPWRGALVSNVFVPAIYRWFSIAASQNCKNAFKKELKQPFAPEGNWATAHLKDFLERYGSLTGAEARSVCVTADLSFLAGGLLDQIAKEVRLELEDVLLSAAAVAEAFAVDLIVVSGKTSELTSVEKLIKTVFCLPQERIVFVKNSTYGANDQYRIDDAKEATVLGGVIYSLWKSGLLTKTIAKIGLKATAASANMAAKTGKWWGVVCPDTSLFRRTRLEEQPIVFNAQSGNNGKLYAVTSDSIIGRQFYEKGVPPMPLYKVSWSGNGAGSKSLILECDINSGQDMLTIVNAWEHDPEKSDSFGERFSSDITLDYQTHLTENSWRDDGCVCID